MYLLKNAMKSVLILSSVSFFVALKIRSMRSQADIMKNVETLSGPLVKKTVDHLSTSCKSNSTLSYFFIIHAV